LGGARAASDYLLEIDGIKGESSDSKHRDTIEIESFSWGATNTGSASNAITLKLGKRLDKSSPLLFLRCAKGEHIPKATLICKRTGKDGGSSDYYVVTFEDILVSSFQTSAAGGGSGGTAGDPVPTDQISLNFTKIKLTYIRLDQDGQPAEEPITAEAEFSKTAGTP
jgi:type VI secretion system secreted protein Hcp